jgi:formylglycine-generating enzyme required for sulfatase activity
MYNRRQAGQAAVGRFQTTIAVLLGVLGVWFAGSPSFAQQSDLQRRLVHEQPPSGKRIALVVGNDNYRGVRKLQNAVNDANDLGRVLAGLGFEADIRTDADLRTIENAIDQFVRRISPGDVALFHYSGHGVQLDGQNYLIPVDFVLRDRADVKYTAYSASRVHDRMVGASSRLNIVILDACRDSGFWPSRGPEPGLAAMDAAEGSFIAFSTAPGRTASDGVSGTNGLFTGQLLEVLRGPGLKLDEVFNAVRANVFQASEKKQLPWTSSSMIGEFYFQPPVAAVAPAPPDTGLQIELSYWNSIQNCEDTGCFDGYLKRYGEGGQFSELARIRRNQLLRKSAGPAEKVVAQRPATSAPPAGDQKLKSAEAPAGPSEPATVNRDQLLPKNAGAVGNAGAVENAAAERPTPGAAPASGQNLKAGETRVRPVEPAKVDRPQLLAKATGPAEGGVVRPPIPGAPPVNGQPFNAGEVRVNPADGLNYRWIPPGAFQMGCSAGDSECAGDERPARQVTISRGFWLGESEVTVEAYKRYASAKRLAMPPPTPLNGGWRDDRQPAVNVTWNEADAYCAWTGGRLPGEAEWELAARAGSPAARYGDVKEIAWFKGNSGGRIHPVGQKKTNGWGLHDILGNVWEWTADRYDKSRYNSAPETDPKGPDSGRMRVLRGGSWNDEAAYLRASHRYGYLPGFRSGGVGFRCALEAVP